MKIRGDYFTVPVDLTVMASCRSRAGYKTVKQFRAETKRRGYPFQYNEFAANGAITFRNDKAELIAEAMGMPVTIVFPQYAEMKAAYIRATAPVTAKEMGIYFLVPVDADVLRSCRERAGYPSASEFTRALSRKAGCPLKYREYENPNSDRQRVKGNKAELIAEAMGMPVTVVFPQYAEAKAAQEKFVDERYYKPFATIAERDAAILDTMEIARGAALKYGHMYVNRLPYCFSFDRDEMISIGYETLVRMGNEAMRKGIKKDTEFKYVVIVAIKYTFAQLCIRSRSSMGSEDFAMFSLLENDMDIHLDFNLEEYVLLRDEAYRAVQTLPKEKWHDPYIRQLIAVCFPQGVPPYA